MTESSGEKLLNRRKSLGWRQGVILLFAVVIILPLRMISEVDPGWRPPILAHAAIVFGLTHMILWYFASWKLSLWFFPVTLFGLTAVPLPWQIEQGVVRTLTGTVVSLTSETFLLLGRPVESVGERLVLGDEMVEVTEGCSGIRSLQSLGMAALFFGELLLLSWNRRFILIGVAAVCAVLVNTARAWCLAEIHFSKGAAAADAAHDGIGHIAFAVSAGILFGVAYLLQSRQEVRKQIVVRRVQKTQVNAVP